MCSIVFEREVKYILAIDMVSSSPCFFFYSSFAVLSRVVVAIVEVVEREE